MRAAVHAVCLAAVVSWSAAVVAGQWPKHPTPGVPRNAAGEPDMSAAAPRTADGKPDLSGLWRGGGGFGARRGAAPPPDPKSPPVAGFANIGQNIKEGLPLTTYGAELLKTRQDGNSKDNPEAHCLPMGIVQLHTQAAPRKYNQTQRELIILYEPSAERREI